MIVTVPPYEGEYEIDLTTLTQLEYRWVKKISGYLPVTMVEGFRGGDPDLLLSLAIVAMRRAGKIRKDEVLDVAEAIEDAAPALLENAAVTMRADPDDEDDDEADPTIVSSPPDSPPDSGGSSSEPTDVSPANVSHLHTGRPDSGTGSDSAQATSAP